MITDAAGLINYAYLDGNHTDAEVYNVLDPETFEGLASKDGSDILKSGWLEKKGGTIGECLCLCCSARPVVCILWTMHDL